jgi:hypothetical protein
MSDDVRLIHRPGREMDFVLGNGAPRGNSKEAIVARNNLGEFLDAMLIRPLWFDESQQMQRVEQSLNTMTRAERIAIEIEMTQASKVMHSYDYDALR